MVVHVKGIEAEPRYFIGNKFIHSIQHEENKF